MQDKAAFSTHMSPRNSTIPTKEEFYASQGFRSAVRKTTHQEINEMLRAAHPEVYEEHRRQKAASLRRNLRHGNTI